MGVQIAKTDIFDKQIGVNMKNKPAFMCDYFGKGEVSDASRMTLRDYFAAKAMQAMTERGEASQGFVAMQAYKVADAMLKARVEDANT
jgi:hypothetical protein